MSAGRLTLEEFDERLTRAYAAKTFGELEELTADLPAVEPARPPVPTHPQPAVPASTGGSACGHWSGWDDAHSSWRSWLNTSLIVIAIWATISLASWELLYFWPVWVIGPWGAVLLAQTLTGGREDGEKTRRLEK
jgi:hypothetical protein